MELEKHEEIVKWIQDNFPQDKFFRESIVEDLAQFFEKLPDDYLMEYTENPNSLLLKIRIWMGWRHVSGEMLF